MTVVASTPKNPGMHVGASYTGGISNYPGGHLTINDVTPWPGRSTGTSTSAMAQQESIARQYGSSRSGSDAVNN